MTLVSWKILHTVLSTKVEAALLLHANLQTKKLVQALEFSSNEDIIVGAGVEQAYRYAMHAQ